VCCKCKEDCWTYGFNETINCERYLRVEGQHFQHLLWSVNCNYFIPNVIGCRACWFTAKIGMRLAASGAPVAVEPVNKVKIIPVELQRTYQSGGKHKVTQACRSCAFWNKTHNHQCNQAVGLHPEYQSPPSPRDRARVSLNPAPRDEEVRLLPTVTKDALSQNFCTMNNKECPGNVKRIVIGVVIQKTCLFTLLQNMFRYCQAEINFYLTRRKYEWLRNVPSLISYRSRRQLGSSTLVSGQLCL
jgi:hypothetical protein